MKYKEEFVKERLLFAYIKSFSHYKDIKSLADVSQHDIKIFTKGLHREIKRDGIEDIERQIRNAAAYYKIDIPDIERGTKNG